MAIGGSSSSGLPLEARVDHKRKATKELPVEERQTKAAAIEGRPAEEPMEAGDAATEWLNRQQAEREPEVDDY